MISLSLINSIVKLNQSCGEIQEKLISEKIDWQSIKESFLLMLSTSDTSDLNQPEFIESIFNLLEKIFFQNKDPNDILQFYNEIYGGLVHKTGAEKLLGNIYVLLAEYIFTIGLENLNFGDYQITRQESLKVCLCLFAESLNHWGEELKERFIVIMANVMNSYYREITTIILPQSDRFLKVKDITGKSFLISASQLLEYNNETTLINQILSSSAILEDFILNCKNYPQISNNTNTNNNSNSNEMTAGEMPNLSILINERKTTIQKFFTIIANTVEVLTGGEIQKSQESNADIKEFPKNQADLDKCTKHQVDNWYLKLFNKYQCLLNEVEKEKEEEENFQAEIDQAMIISQENKEGGADMLDIFSLYQAPNSLWNRRKRTFSQINTNTDSSNKKEKIDPQNSTNNSAIANKKSIKDEKQEQEQEYEGMSPRRES